MTYNSRNISVRWRCNIYTCITVWHILAETYQSDDAKCRGRDHRELGFTSTCESKVASSIPVGDDMFSRQSLASNNSIKDCNTCRLEIKILAWDRHRNVIGLNWLIGYHSLYCEGSSRSWSYSSWI
jgi:hypothetical protein